MLFRSLSGADLVITVSRNLASLFESKLSDISNKPIEIITNGFDPKDFENQNSKTFISNYPNIEISYTGTLSDDYNLLGFLDAVNQVAISSERTFRLNFTGSISPKWVAEIEKLHSNVQMEFSGQVSHEKAIRQMQNSDLLLLLIPSIDGNKGIITGKIFEYIASGRPVLGIGPIDGDASEILSETGGGKMFDYFDTPAIKEFLLSDFVGNYKPDKEKLAKYSRPVLTKNLTKLIQGS